MGLDKELRKVAPPPTGQEVAEQGKHAARLVAAAAAGLVRYRYPGGRPCVPRELLADRLSRGDVLTPEELAGPEYAAKMRELGTHDELSRYVEVWPDGQLPEERGEVDPCDDGEQRRTYEGG